MSTVIPLIERQVRDGRGLVHLRTDDVVLRTPVPVPVEPDGTDSARTLVADLRVAAR